MDQPVAPRVKLFASATIVGVAAFTVVVAVFHLLRPDLKPSEDYISYYAVGRYGLLMVAAFIALGLGCLALAIGIRATMRGVVPLVGCTLLGLAGVGLIVGGVARTDLEGQAVTTMGNVHVLGAAVVGLLGLFLSVMVLTVTFIMRSPWRSFRPLWLALALLMVVVFVAFGTISTTAAGLGQRVLVGAELLWLLVAASRLRTIAAPRGADRLST